MEAVSAIWRSCAPDERLPRRFPEIRDPSLPSRHLRHGGIPSPRFHRMREDSETRAAVESNPATRRRPVVLIVDDERLLLNAIRRELRNEPFELVTMSDPYDALKRVENGRVDLLI